MILMAGPPDGGGTGLLPILFGFFLLVFVFRLIKKNHVKSICVRNVGTKIHLKQNFAESVVIR